jgi:hypothetical protein
MTRDQKTAQRAESRARRRRPQADEESNGSEQANARDEELTRAKRQPPQGVSGDELADVATQARELLRALRGVEAESVSGVSRTQDGWKVSLEVVELHRIPESTDVLASYEVELDGDGKVLGFSRGPRYSRSQTESGAGP